MLNRAAPDAATDACGQPAPVSEAYSRYVLGLLFVVYVFNFIDRQVLGILLDDIKRDLQVSDTAMGLLAGFTFAVFYTIAGIPIARWADHGSRRSIIALGLAVWSGMTALCGLAQNYWQLAAARIGVGIGEAAGSPPAHSLISDYFPPARRATALAIYGAAVYPGTMLAFMLGGYIKQWLDWRSVFLLVGLPGLLLAILVRYSLREPKRGMSEPEGAADATAGATTLRETLRFLLGCPAFIFIALGSAIQSLAGYSVMVWGPSFLARVHGLSGTQIGTWLGLSVGIAGFAGAYFGGRLTDWLGQADSRWYMRLPAAESLVALPLIGGFLLAGDAVLAMLCFIPYYVLGAMYLGPMFAMTHALVRLRMRATASAVLLFVVNLVGLGLGPLLVGLLNDTVFRGHGSGAIRYSLLAVSCMGACASVMFWLASRRLPADLARARN